MFRTANENEAFRVLLVGLGKVGFLYDVTNELECLTHAKGVTRASLFYGKKLLLNALEPSPKKREMFVNVFSESNAFSRIEDLPNKVFDLVILACTTDEIVPMCLDLQEKIQCRYYLLEKPVCKNLDSMQLFASKVSPELDIRVGFPRRSLPSVNYLKELLQTKYPSDEWSIKVVIGGDFLNIGVHFLDLIYYLLGDFAIKDLTYKKGLVRFFAEGNGITIEGEQVGRVNTEDSLIELKGPVNIIYSKAGRLINLNNHSHISEFSINTAFEIQNMIGFEALDYTSWASGKDVSRLATLDGNPIREVLRALKEA